MYDGDTYRLITQEARSDDVYREPDGRQALLREESSACGLKHRSSLDVFVWALLILLVVETISIIVVKSPKPGPPPPSGPHSAQTNTRVVATWERMPGSDCGTSSAEAIANGCIFDVLRYAWIPPQCYDDVAVEEAGPSGQWRFYLDKNRSVPLSSGPENLALHETAYTQWGYHVQHCRYLYILAGRASKYELLISNDLASFTHALHCGMVLAETRMAPEMVGTKVERWYATCGNLLVRHLELQEIA